MLNTISGLNMQSQSDPDSYYQFLLRKSQHSPQGPLQHQRTSFQKKKPSGRPWLQVSQVDLIQLYLCSGQLWRLPVARYRERGSKYSVCGSVCDGGVHSDDLSSISGFREKKPIKGKCYLSPVYVSVYREI